MEFILLILKNLNYPFFQLFRPFIRSLASAAQGGRTSPLLTPCADYLCNVGR